MECKFLVVLNRNVKQWQWVETVVLCGSTENGLKEAKLGLRLGCGFNLNIDFGLKFKLSNRA